MNEHFKNPQDQKNEEKIDNLLGEKNQCIDSKEDLKSWK